MKYLVGSLPHTPSQDHGPKAERESQSSHHNHHHHHRHPSDGSKTTTKALIAAVAVAVHVDEYDLSGCIDIVFFGSRETKNPQY